MAKKISTKIITAVDGYSIAAGESVTLTADPQVENPIGIVGSRIAGGASAICISYATLSNGSVEFTIQNHGSRSYDTIVYFRILYYDD